MQIPVTISYVLMPHAREVSLVKHIRISDRRTYFIGVVTPEGRIVGVFFIIYFKEDLGQSDRYSYSYSMHHTSN